jgi:hypothetical protein
MRRNLWALVVLAWILTASLAAAADRWVHVKVTESGEGGERVRVNIPLSLAEKVLPTINTDKLRNGKIRVNQLTTDKVDLRALLEAVRETPDNEFITVQSTHEDVRVAKSGGFLLIKVQDFSGLNRKSTPAGERKPGSTVNIKVPFPVVNALLSGEKDELDVLAAIRVLDNSQDVDLVNVNDERNTVRVWVDSRNLAD